MEDMIASLRVQEDHEVSANDLVSGSRGGGRLQAYWVFLTPDLLAPFFKLGAFSLDDKKGQFGVRSIFK